MNFFKLFMVFTCLAMHNQSLPSYMIPKLSRLPIIPTLQTSKILKLQTQSNILIMLTNNFSINTYSKPSYTQFTNITETVKNCFNQTISYIDFSFDKYDSVSLSAMSRIIVINLTTNSVLYSRVKYGAYFTQTQLTQKFMIVLITDRSFQVHNRANYNYKTYSIPQNYLLSSESTKNYIQTCELNSGDYYLVFWNSCNAIAIAKSVGGMLINNFNNLGWRSTYPACNTNINTIKFNKNCSLMLIQMDNLTEIQVYNLNSQILHAKIQKPTQVVYSVQFYDPTTSNYVIVFYKNNSIIFYDISQSAVGVFIGQVNQNITFNTPIFIDTNSWRLYYPGNNNAYIQVYKFQCPFGTAAYDKCCEAQQFYNLNTTTCQFCSIRFQYCSTCNESACLSCLTGTFFSGLCCQSNQYFDILTNSCLSCQNKYSYCHNCNQTSCLSCLTGNYFSGLCCQQNQYYNLSFSSCQSCSSRFDFCNTCDKTGCSSCLIGTFYQGKCCQSNQYFNPNDIKCKLCSSKFDNCLSCTQKKCQSCLTGTITYGKCCLQNQSYNARSGQCQPCTAHCLKCKGGSCLLCQKTFVLMLNTCIQVSNDANVIALSASTESVRSNSISNPFAGSLIKNPISKTIINAVCGFFGPLDDLWMFSYHERNYTLTVSSLLNSIREIQSSKFNLFNDVQVISNVTNGVIDNLNNYTYFGKQKYMAIEQVSSGFYQNVVNFVIVMIPQTIFMFVVIRLFFNLFINCKISKFLREYTFNVFFILTLLDGNQQFFVYTCSNQLQTLFHTNHAEKQQLLMFLIACFLFLQALVTSYLLMKYFYGKLASYFMDNNKNSIPGVFILILNSSLRNLAVAGISSFSSDNYQLLIWSLNAVEFLFILAFLVFLIKFKCFKYKTDFCITLIFAFLRLLLQLSFAILNKKVIEKDIQQKVQSLIILLYLVYWILTILFFLIKMIVISLIQYYFTNIGLKLIVKQIKKQVDNGLIIRIRDKKEYNENKNFKVPTSKFVIKQKKQQQIKVQQLDEIQNIDIKMMNQRTKMVFYSLPLEYNSQENKSKNILGVNNYVNINMAKIEKLHNNNLTNSTKKGRNKIFDKDAFIQRQIVYQQLIKRNEQIRKQNIYSK